MRRCLFLVILPNSSSQEVGSLLHLRTHKGNYLRRFVEFSFTQGRGFEAMPFPCTAISAVHAGSTANHNELLHKEATSNFLSTVPCPGKPCCQFLGQEKFQMYIQVILNNLLICCMMKDGQKMYYLEEYGKAPPPYICLILFAKDDGFYYNRLVHF